MGIKLNVKCQCCNSDDESTLHALWNYRKPCHEFIYVNSRRLSMDDLSLLCVYVWRIWYLRNSFLFDYKVTDIKSTIGLCKNCLSNYYNSYGKATASPEHLPGIWSPPNLGSFKLNCTAVTDSRNRKDLVISDHVGLIMSCYSLFLNVGLDHITANYVAILRGLNFGKSRGFHPFYVESEATSIVSLINSGNHLYSSCGNIVKDIIGLMNDLSIPTMNHGKKGSFKPASDLAKQMLLWKRNFACASS
ncbi:hypothetical protein Dsin_005198 [Dipteronia sinensis]|uniref:RNase H type-1 domain-containing protein n=1 Tax=Dipteronia sinensis TaxID=43782 RepID=A0AAE0EEG8_9ROSI|nr:hypothetical protein Dsin_005198 [Dipteronia sinensis]